MQFWIVGSRILAALPASWWTITASLAFSQVYVRYFTIWIQYTTGSWNIWSGIRWTAWKDQQSTIHSMKLQRQIRTNWNTLAYKYCNYYNNQELCVQKQECSTMQKMQCPKTCVDKTIFAILKLLLHDSAPATFFTVPAPSYLFMIVHHSQMFQQIIFLQLSLYHMDVHILYLMTWTCKHWHAKTTHQYTSHGHGRKPYHSMLQQCPGH